MSSLRSVWALLRSKVQNEGKQYGSWRHKLKQECLCFDKLNMTEDAVGGFAYLLIRLAGLRAKDGSPLGGGGENKRGALTGVKNEKWLVRRGAVPYRF